MNNKNLKNQFRSRCHVLPFCIDMTICGQIAHHIPPKIKNYVHIHFITYKHIIRKLQLWTGASQVMLNEKEVHLRATFSLETLTFSWAYAKYQN